MDADKVRKQLTSEKVEIVVAALLGESVSSKGNFTQYNCKIDKSKKPHTLGVDHNSGKFNCFKCEEKGGMFDLSMLVDKITFTESISRVASLAGLIVTKPVITQAEYDASRAYLAANPEPDALPEVDPYDIDLQSFYAAIGKHRKQA